MSSLKRLLAQLVMIADRKTKVVLAWLVLTLMVVMVSDALTSIGIYMLLKVDTSMNEGGRLLSETYKYRLILLLVFGAISVIAKILYGHLTGIASTRLTNAISSVIIPKMLASQVSSNPFDRGSFLFASTKAMDIYNLHVVRSIFLIASACFPSFALLVALVCLNPMLSAVAILTLGLVYSVTYPIIETRIRRRSKVLNEKESMYNESLSALHAAFCEIAILSRDNRVLALLNKADLGIRKDQAFIAQQSIISRNIIETSGLVLILFILFLSSQYQQNGSGMGGVPLAGAFVFSLQKLLVYSQLMSTSYSMINGNHYSIKLASKLLIHKRKSEVYNVMLSENKVYRENKILDMLIFKNRSAGKTNNYNLDTVLYSSNLGRLNLDFSNNRFIRLTGKSGSGKSSVLKGLLGLSPFDESVNYYVNDNLKPFDQFDFVNSHVVGYCPQRPSLLHDTLMGNLVIWSDQHGTLSESYNELEELIKYLDMHKILDINKISGKYNLINPSTNTYSGGELQRISLIRSLINKPRFLVLDEATSALDSLMEEKVFDLIKTSNDYCQTSVLFVTHNQDLVKYADHEVCIIS